jgi:hypothetical protein
MDKNKKYIEQGNLKSISTNERLRILESLKVTKQKNRLLLKNGSFYIKK